MSKVDVELLYGVSGGGELSGASGQEIAKSLRKIVRGLEKSKIPTIKLFFDTQDLEAKLKTIKEKINKVLGSTGNLKNFITIQSRESGGNSTHASKTLTASQKRQQTMYKKLKEAIEETSKSENKLYKARTKNSDIYVDKIKQQAQAMDELESKLKRYPLKNELKSDLSSYKNKLSSDNGIVAKEELTSLQTSYDKLVYKSGQFVAKMKDQGMRTTEAKERLEELQYVMEKEIHLTGDASKDLQMLRNEYNKLNRTYSETTNYMARSGELNRTPWQKLIDAVRNKFQSMISGLLIASAGRALMQVYNNVVKLDEAVTNLQIATGGTRKETQELIRQYSKLAQEIGATTLEVAEAADTWLRQGYSLKETNQLIKDTMMLSKLGQLNSSEAAKALTSAIKGYKVEVSEATSIVDKFTAVDMKAAISAGDIATAMAETAASAEVAGIAMDKLIGYISVVGEVTQDGAESVGTFYKTMFARMGSISAGNFIDSETGESFNDVEIVLNKLGISLRDEAGTFRDFSTVLDEVAANWENYTNVQQHAIATAFSGTRQQEKFIVLMENYGTALEYAAVSAESAGTATAKYQEAYMDSIEAKVNKLTASWQEFSSNLLDSDVVKFFVDLIRVIAQVLNTIISFGNGFAVKGAVIIGTVVLMQVAFTALKTRMEAAFGSGAIATFKDFIAAIQLGAGKLWASLKPLLKNGMTYLTLFITLMTTINNKWAKVGVSLVAIVGVIVAAIISGIKAVDGATKSFMATNPIGWILLLVSAVITLIKTIDELVRGKSYEDIKQEGLEAKDAWEEATQAVSEAEDKLKDVQDKIKQINDKGGITLVDQKQLDALKEQEAKLQQQIDNEKELAKQKEKEAASKAQASMDKYADTKTRSGYKWWQWLVSPWWAVGEIIADNASDTQEEKLNKIFNNWSNATEEEKKFASDYLSELNEVTSGFDYYVDDGNLEDWQKKMNAYLDEYNYVQDRFSIVHGNFDSLWNSIFSRTKYKEGTSSLQQLADDLNVTEDSLRDLYSNNSSVKQFIDYLQKIGLFSWDDADKIEQLVQQIRSLAKAANPVSLQDYMSILSSMSKEYDLLRSALEEIEEQGVLSYDTLKELTEEYPLLFEKLQASGDLVKGADGYTLNKDTLLNYLQSVRDSYAETVKSAQEYYDKVLKAYEEGRVNKSDVDSAKKSLENAIDNQLEAEVVINTLERTDLIEEFTEKLKKQSDELENQLDKYKDIVDIRKDLLETYQDEIDYQKTLAQKQKNVADIQTRLALARLDTSAAGQANVRDLESKLQDAQDELSEYTLEKAIEDLSAQLDDEYSEYEDFINKQIESITDAIDKAATMTSEALRKALSGGYPVQSHHTGGFVSGAQLNSHEQFAKLLNGELVVTPQQMSKFMDNTLPEIATQGGNISYNSPLIEIHCDNVTQDTLPELEKIVNKAVKKVKEEIDKTIERSGKTKSVDKFKI